jgi:hypothetical protein
VSVSIIETSKGVDIANKGRDLLPRAACFLEGIGCGGVEP